MKQYLLNIYQPDSDPPPADVLAEIMRDVRAIDEELRAAGAWVFSGGLRAPWFAQCRQTPLATRQESPELAKFFI
jgi:hypothetical protein